MFSNSFGLKSILLMCILNVHVRLLSNDSDIPQSNLIGKLKFFIFRWGRPRPISTKAWRGSTTEGFSCKENTWLPRGNEQPYPCTGPEAIYPSLMPCHTRSIEFQGGICTENNKRERKDHFVKSSRTLISGTLFGYTCLKIPSVVRNISE